MKSTSVLLCVFLASALSVSEARRRLWTAPGIIINDIRNSHTVCTGLCERKSQDNFGNVQCHKDYHCMQRCNRGGSCAPINDELEDFDEEAGKFSVEAGYEKDGKYAKIKWEKDEMDDDGEDGLDLFERRQRRLGTGCFDVFSRGGVCREKDELDDEMEDDEEDCVENCQEERGLSRRSCKRRCNSRGSW